GYLAPEILYGDDATTASDVHSWAATVVFASTGRPPFGTGPAMAIMDRVRRGEHDLSSVPRTLLPLLRACLEPDPDDRPETAAVLASLRGPARPPVQPTPAVVRDDPTMPYALAAPTTPDEQRTDVYDATSTVPQRTDRPGTRPLTVPVQPQHAGPSVLQPARSPYMEPPPPRADSRPGLVPAQAWRPPP